MVYAGGEVQAELSLPALGLISIQPLEFITQRLGAIKKKLKEMGCSLTDPHLTLTTLTCAAIPHLRICEEGLASLKEGETLDLILR